MNHSFDIELAAQYGLHEAILIANFQFWIGKNRANGRHHYDGRTWTYNSARALAELFPYLSDRQIRRTLDSLVEAGVLVKGNYNPSTYDRTLWYAFADESRFLFGQIHLPKSVNGIAEIGDSHTDINQIEKTDVNKSSGGYDDLFDEFWNAYPNKKAKDAARKAFAKRKPGRELLDQMLAAIAAQKKSHDWTKDGGKYIPHPATWLNAGRWEDEIRPPTVRQSTHNMDFASLDYDAPEGFRSA